MYTPLAFLGVLETLLTIPTEGSKIFQIHACMNGCMAYALLHVLSPAGVTVSGASGFE